MAVTKRLRVKWSKRERALLYHHEDSAANAHLLATFFEYMQRDGKTLKKHLEDRGYDLTTLKFEVTKKVAP